MDPTHDDESSAVQRHLEVLLLEGLESGEPIEVTPGVLAQETRQDICGI